MYNLLREDIQSKIGTKILHEKDSVLLSKQIYKETHRQISSSTIKRFFGLINSQFNASKFTLETFAVFLGFNDWPDFLNNYNKSNHLISNGNTWDNYKNRTLIITEYSLESLKKKTGYKADKRISRSFIKRIFNSFLKSTATATMLIAPDGYGKSTLLIQLIEDYFLGAKPKYENDIVTLIDGGIFFNLQARNTDIDQFSQLMKINISSSLEYFFHKNQDKRKGRIWLIIDNIDEIFFAKEQYLQFVENLARIIMANDFSWYKMILTCRPENLDVFSYLIKRNPLLKKSFHGVRFEEDNPVKTINIPLFNKREIGYILENNQFKYDYDFLLNHQKNILKIIRHPYFLSLFVEEFKRHENISEIMLLNHFLQRRLYSPPLREEKLFIVDQFIDLCERGKETNLVHKNELLSKANYDAAFRELISYGIIYEYVNPSEWIYRKTLVKFNQNIIFEYLLFQKWRSVSPLDGKLFFTIKAYYESNIQLQCNLLKFFIRFAIYEEKFDLIKEIHFKFESVAGTSQTEFAPCLSTVAKVIKETLQTNNQFKEYLTPWISTSRLGKRLYAT